MPRRIARYLDRFVASLTAANRDQRVIHTTPSMPSDFTVRRMRTAISPRLQSAPI